jgi:hypothetical protein
MAVDGAWLRFAFNPGAGPQELKRVETRRLG